MRWFFLLLPWVELFSLIQLGSRIGAFSALLYVFFTLLLGLTLLRAQGAEMVGKLRAAQNGQFISERLLRDDLAVGLAAFLLMIPGLVTDALALLVLFGPLRRRLFSALGTTDSTQRPGPTRSGPGESIDGEFRRLDDD
jgi:UPF0716 protein FxsA